MKRYLTFMTKEQRERADAYAVYRKTPESRRRVERLVRRLYERPFRRASDGQVSE